MIRVGELGRSPGNLESFVGSWAMNDWVGFFLECELVCVEDKSCFIVRVDRLGKKVVILIVSITARRALR